MSLKTVRSALWASLVAAAALSVLSPVAAAAGDAARGAKLAYTCYGCHGIPDYRNTYPTYHVPKVFGQRADYIVAALAEYKAGARKHPTMRGQAGSLSDQNIADIAAFLAGKEELKGDGPTGTPPAAVAACAACHGADGVAIPGTGAPTLAGQHADYLLNSLQAYKKGTRVNGIMQGFAATLSPADMQAAAKWFAAQKPGLWTQKADGRKF
jgi:cytochrome c553